MVLPDIEKGQRPTIGVAFGGGGLKGSAHIGVLQAFEENDIPIDFVAGTSIGSAIAALYASGYDWRKMDILFHEFNLDTLLKVRPTRLGMIPATGYTELIRTCTKGKNIEEMDIPLRIVAVDMVKWEKIVFDKGDTASAVRASSAVPGVFTPVKMGKMLLTDGGVLDNCPTDVVRGMGADIVIGIDLFSPSHNEPKTFIDVIVRALDIATSVRDPQSADIVLQPMFEHVGILDKRSIALCRQMGLVEAREKMPEIKALIAAKSKL